ncbi:sensor histidine kinase [Sinomonas albida]|uniref:sensor histidine kinase n=1 Tax=Sinomonas albida TaxID=369942 RepID=UPI00301755D4
MDDAGSLRAKIVQRYIAQLCELNSPLVADPRLRLETAQGADVILKAVLPGGINHEVPVTGSPTATIGTSRALQQIHPSFSLEASVLLFETGVDEIRRRIPTFADPEGVVDLISGLQRSIMERVVPASSQYVDVLLEKIDQANQFERKNVSRHLHDNVAHGIIAAIQRIQLIQKTGDQHTELLEINVQLNYVVSLLQETLLSVRDVATSLRDSVGDRTLDSALSDLLENTVGFEGKIELITSGEVASLAPHLKEELFLILREGIRNSLRHADSTMLRVGVSVSPDEVMAFVEDDGAGFEPPLAAKRSGLGLFSMAERAKFLGGSLSVHSAPGRGCTVKTSIPAVEGKPMVLS